MIVVAAFQLTEACLAVFGLCVLARAFSRTRLGRWLSSKQSYTTPYGEALVQRLEGADAEAAWAELQEKRNSEAVVT